MTCLSSPFRRYPSDEAVGLNKVVKLLAVNGRVGQIALVGQQEDGDLLAVGKHDLVVDVIAPLVLCWLVRRDNGKHHTDGPLGDSSIMAPLDTGSHKEVSSPLEHKGMRQEGKTKKGCCSHLVTASKVPCWERKMSARRRCRATTAHPRHVKHNDGSNGVAVIYTSHGAEPF